MQAPKVTTNVAVLDNDALLPALRQGQIDIALTNTRQSSLPDFARERLRVPEPRSQPA
jgi:hypothetical protein